jgi:predicted DNA repair protein MutK
LNNLNFDLFTFIPQLINLLILVSGIYLIFRLIIKAGNWFHRRRTNEEEIIRKLDELVKLHQVSTKDKD